MFKQFANMKIGTKLTIVVSTAMASLLIIMGVFTLVTSRNALSDTISQMVLNKASDAAELISHDINSSIKRVEDVSRKIRIRSMDWGQQKPALLEDLVGLEFVDSLGVANKDGITNFTNDSETEFLKENIFKRL